jgi:hypothetical protein
MGLGHGIRGDAAETVQKGALLRLVEARCGLVLRVDQSQFRGELAQNGDRGRLVIDEDAALARRENFPAKSMPFSSRMLSAPGVDSKTQETTALSAPWRTTSAEALPPISRASASTRMDLPAPVSPVSRLSPGPKTAMA